jgi:indolepyruvate decarboxylase
MMERMIMRQAIGNFLLRRLQEAGIKHIFGVPGDYNLGLMQQLEDRGEPARIGNCNELNGSYTRCRNS